MFPALAGRFFTTTTAWEAPLPVLFIYNNMHYVIGVAKKFVGIFDTILWKNPNKLFGQIKKQQLELDMEQ